MRLVNVLVEQFTNATNNDYENVINFRIPVDVLKTLQSNSCKLVYVDNFNGLFEVAGLQFSFNVASIQNAKTVSKLLC